MTSVIGTSRSTPGLNPGGALDSTQRTGTSQPPGQSGEATPAPIQARLDFSRSSFDPTPAGAALQQAVLLGGQPLAPTLAAGGVAPAGAPAGAGRTAEHNRIIEAAGRTRVDPGTREWTTADVARWRAPLVGDPNHIHAFKEQWVNGYSDTIRQAAQMYNLPEELVAGVAYNEVGGDPQWIDDVAHGVRSFDHMADPLLEPLTITRRPELTSFGNVSMQVRRAAETLGYDPANLTGDQQRAVIDSLKDPRQNIFIAAAHLAQLRDIDFPGRGAGQMSQDDIRVTATRFNRGPDLSLERIRQDTSYGNSIINRWSRLQELMR